MIKDKYAILLMVITLTSVITLVFGYASDGLIYDGANKAQLWRFFTAHFSHYDHHHLFGNLIAFALLVYLFPQPAKLQLQAIILAIALLDIYLYVSDVSYYAGFSSLVYVIPGLVFSQLIKNNNWIQAFILFVVMCYWLVFANAIFISADIHWTSLKEGHILGFLAGFMTENRATLFVTLKSSMHN